MLLYDFECFIIMKLVAFTGLCIVYFLTLVNFMEVEAIRVGAFMPAEEM